MELRVETLLHGFEYLEDFRRLRMGERTIDDHVVVAPCVVGRRTAFGSLACGSCDDRRVDVGIEQQIFGERNQRELHGHSKASWVGDVFCSADHRLAIQFRKAVDKIMCAVLDAMVACEVDDLEVFGNGVGLDELAGLAGGTAAEQDIDVFQIDGTGKIHVDLTMEPLMYVDNALSGNGA